MIFQVLYIKFCNRTDNYVKKFLVLFIRRISVIDVIIGIISVSFLFFMVRIFMKFNSATYKNNFTKNDNFIVENVKVIKL